tara:strand:+ start:84 stop:254 length:171 start_codon:yes stop_codon:yes gene_type:complete
MSAKLTDKFARVFLVGTEADLKSQNVKATIDLNASCSPLMFLNEAVRIETLSVNNQ